MSSDLRPPLDSPAAAAGPLRLQNGDHLRREEFERRYDATPGIKKAELIEGIVYVHEPVRIPQHGEPVGHLCAWLASYVSRTPGTRMFSDGTVRIDDFNEAQPDGALFIEAPFGGQARVDAEGYLEGAPELVVEVAASSASYDLHSKLRSYRRAGVKEYVVVRSLEHAVDWFRFGGEGPESRGGGSGGVRRSEVFPGLWLDVDAFLARDLAGLFRRLDEGLASEEHAAFAQGLQEAARGG